MFERLVSVLGYTNLAVLFLPVGLGIYRWPLLNTPLRLVWLALLAYLLLLGLSMLAVDVPTTWTWLISMLIGYVISALFGVCLNAAFWWLLPPGPARQVVGALTVVGLLAVGVEAIVQGRYAQISQWGVPLHTLTNTLISGYFLYWLLRQTRSMLLQKPFFWITVATFAISLLGTLYDALHGQLMAASGDLFMAWLSFQLGSSSVCVLIYAVGFYCVSSVARAA
jgi:hypothetical protein